jgi:hypothetical protein
MRRALAVLLPALASLALASPAAADQRTYIVFATTDAPNAACAAYFNVPNAFTCDSLRSAVAAANANVGFDGILLPTSGTYALTQTPQLTLSDDVVIVGQSAPATTIQGNGSTRVLAVNPDVNATLSSLTISGGRVVQGIGGNILSSGTLGLVHVRITNGTASNGGGGIANVGPGNLSIVSSLIDNNTATSGEGGGILNDGGPGQPATLGLTSSTVALNRGSPAGGISSIGNASNSVSLVQVTIARNTTPSVNPAGLKIQDGTAVSYGSIIAGNVGDTTPSNCSGTITDVNGLSLEDGTGSTCGFTVANPSLDTALTNQGGHTDVLTIPSTGPAKHRVTQCFTGSDQRDAPRATSGGCDAGAFEQGATAPPITPLSIPTPTPEVTPTPVPTPTPTATPTPVAGTTVGVKEVKGKVRVRRPGSNDFVDLDGTQGIPLGSTIDTKQGTVQLTSQQALGAKPQSANFFDGVFKIGQTKTTTDLTLNETLAKCPKAGKASGGAKKPKTRKLWGNGSGSFRTRGQYSAATVRGTEWLVQDSCAGTLTRVKKGAVSVRDLVKRKTIIVRAGKSYLARPKR